MEQKNKNSKEKNLPKDKWKDEREEGSKDGWDEDAINDSSKKPNDNDFKTVESNKSSIVY